jgi:uncharacterized membrane protein YeaQ/YmgE (transglycosylase-associated protein family)
MSILGWIILGGIAGWFANLITGGRQGCFTDIIVGIVGAVVRGFLYSLIGGKGITGFNLGSLLIAIGGAVILLLILHAFRRRTVY